MESRVTEVVVFVSRCDDRSRSGSRPEKVGRWFGPGAARVSTGVAPRPFGWRWKSSEYFNRRSHDYFDCWTYDHFDRWSHDYYDNQPPHYDDGGAHYDYDRRQDHNYNGRR